MTRTTKGTVFVSLLTACAIACVGNGPHFVQAGTDGGSLTDAGIFGDSAPWDAAPKCNPRDPFMSIGPVQGGVNTPGVEQMPFVTASELAMYFSTDHPPSDAGMGQGDLVVSRRVRRTDPWGTPAILKNVNSAVDDQGPWVSADEKTMLFSSDRGGSPDYHIYLATRDSPQVDFGTPGPLQDINIDKTNESQAFLREGIELWFSSNRADGRAFNLYRAPVAGSGYANAVAVTSIGATAAANDWIPQLTADGLVLYFASSRTGPDALGAYDIYRAIRTNVDEDFPLSSVENVRELNSSGTDWPGTIAPDGCRIYFTSDRGGTSDIYMAERTPH